MSKDSLSPNCLSLLVTLYLMRINHLKDDTIVMCRVGKREWAPDKAYIFYGRGWQGEGIYASAPACRWREKWSTIPDRPDPSGTPYEAPFWMTDPERYPDVHRVRTLGGRT